ncbi:hypothetical protein pdam_00021872 [Pocillopora damicornis]|uniref:Uncharacterized protein n=1 Tax=Pocillopora damicornis TaxID=46731 RepID=A0A3M6UYQ4_POCDA|nr:hypothetical protein pdam_00021872 [Pocillopora damicornis]
MMQSSSQELSDKFLFELRLVPVGSVVIGSDEAQLAFELTNIQHEYEVIHCQELADEALSNYEMERDQFDKGSDTIFSESINVPRRSMKGLLQFYEPYVIVNGIPNKVYSRGMKTRDMWEEVFKRFEKENSEMNATDFYAGDRFDLFIYLRSMRDSNLHENGLRFEIGEYEGRSSARNQQECMLSSTSSNVSLKA